MEQARLCWCDAGEDSSSPKGQHQQRRNSARLPASMHMAVSDWPTTLSDTGSPIHSASVPRSLPSNPQQCSPSYHMSNVALEPSLDGAEVMDYKNQSIAEDQSYFNKLPRENRTRNSFRKSEVRKFSGNEAKVEVVLQRLNGNKKGIPDDGHRGWKKYGNKSIQNSNHCRGYYKCSVKECRAKKMVQPTDKDPMVFEITYVGKHTCSSTGYKRNRSTRGSAGSPAQLESIQDHLQGHDKPGDSHISSTDCKKRSNVEMDQVENSRIWTGSNSVDGGLTEPLHGSPSGKRVRRSKDDKDCPDNYSYMNNMAISTITTASEDREQAVEDEDGSLDTYLHQSSRHHQAVYWFQESLSWADFDIEGNLSTGQKSVNIDNHSS
uniref:WRKY domain-containing protein n=1 Tax=Physcomitrium patens TaxID=3218 RepID=A0A7I4DUE3_PHYPA